MARLNDTAAFPITIPSSESSSVSVRVEPIDNGFLTHTCRNGTNGYQSTTRYSEGKPTIVNSVDVAEGSSPDSGNAMARAKAYLQVR